jgi:hypothetical protein
MRSFLASAALTAVFALAGCGDDDGGGAAGGPEGGSPAAGGGGNGGASGETGGAPEGGSPSTGGAGGSGAGGSEPVTRRIGIVGVDSFDYVVSGTPIAQSSATALFLTQEDAPPCEPMVVGACSIQGDCESGGTLVLVSAGAVTFTGGTRDITLVPEADSTYPTDSAPEPLFSGGETLTMSIAGSAEIPAHTEQLVAPDAVEVESPTLASLSVIDRSEDLTLSWSGTGAGEVEIRLIDFASQMVATCTFPSGSSSGAIPTEVLQLLPPTNEAVVQVIVADRAVVPLGEFQVIFLAGTAGLDGASGAPYQKNNLTLE